VPPDSENTIQPVALNRGADRENIVQVSWGHCISISDRYMKGFVVTSIDSRNLTTKACLAGSVSTSGSVPLAVR